MKTKKGITFNVRSKNLLTFEKYLGKMERVEAIIDYPAQFGEFDNNDLCITIILDLTLKQSDQYLLRCAINGNQCDSNSVRGNVVCF